MNKKIKNELYEMKLLMGSVPPVVFTMLVVAVITMNLLANKSIELWSGVLVLDCGMTVSWLTFLVMDIVTKHFGPKAATQLSFAASMFNLAICLLFYLCSIIPGSWGESYVDGSTEIINHALNKTFGGTWYILLGSTIAFLLSSCVNNFTNYAIGTIFCKNRNGYAAYAARTYISTAIGQFVDNLTFSLLVSRVFFGWTLPQCVLCALTGMAVELFCEVCFSFWGYKICEKWKREKVGEDYLNYLSNGEK